MTQIPDYPALPHNEFLATAAPKPAGAQLHGTQAMANLGITTFQAPLRAPELPVRNRVRALGQPRFQEANSGLRRNQGRHLRKGHLRRDMRKQEEVPRGLGRTAHQPDSSDRGDLKVGPPQVVWGSRGSPQASGNGEKGPNDSATLKPLQEPGPGGCCPKARQEAIRFLERAPPAL